MLVFGESGKPVYLEKKALEAAQRTNKLNPLVTPGPQIEPRPHWWEASTLTTAPSLLPSNILCCVLEQHFTLTAPLPSQEYSGYKKKKTHSHFRGVALHFLETILNK